jgi:hypothetical protein
MLLVTGAERLCAQTDPQEPSDGPPSGAQTKPAARSIPPLDPGESDQDQSQQLQPDTMPLTGIATPTLGSPEYRHSFWIPGVQYASSILSGQSGQNTNGWSVDNYIMGNLSLVKQWSRSELALNYSGGGILSSGSQGNGSIQQLALAQTFQWNRWQLVLLDQFSYLPQTSFGFGGGTNLGTPGTGISGGPSIPSIGNGGTPNQSVFASTGPRYSNAAAAQLTYQLTRRGSITVSGVYSILHFVDPGNFDNNAIMATIGYNYQLSREDAIGLSYSFGNFQYPGQPQAFGNQVIRVTYGRKITGRLALQVAGGPQISTYRIPIDGQSTKLGGNLNASLTYAMKNGSISAGYSHGLSGGSGVFLGSTLNEVTVNANRTLTRVWSGQANFGYGHNSSVAAASQTVFAQNYNSWIFGAGVNRPFGRNVNFAAAYSVNINKHNLGDCTGSDCNASQTINYITLSFQWHTRPLVLP